MNDSEKPKSWRERKQSIKHKWTVPLVYVEWRCEQLSKLLEQWAFLDILGHAGRLSIIVAVILYFAESGGRQKAKHYQAWQVINSAKGKPGNGGRVDALHDLHRDGISLVGVDISNAFLPDLNLKNANLYTANLAGSGFMRLNLAGAQLSEANFSKAELPFANLTRAKLINANLAGAVLTKVNLVGADLTKANLVGANILLADLTRADLTDANLNAFLGEVNLTGADLTRANFDIACLNFANLANIKGWREIKSIEKANIFGVENPPDGFVEWATERGAVSIEDPNEWEKLIREKMQEKTKEK